MNEIVTRTTLMPVVPAALPVAKVGLTFRLATSGDLPFIDGLQKKHHKQLGHFPTQQFEGYIKMGGILVAEANGRPVGHCISRDRYLKRDELGVIFQLCVEPGEQRKFVGAALIREVFERSAYGCRLYCCWCAQDIAANYFWESIGFVPIAFRAGSDKKQRVHIFWQKRIREGDTTTPYWFPAKTEGGAMRADRLILPIPPGMRWSDAMPVLNAEVRDQRSEVREEKKPRRARLTSDLRPLTSGPTSGPVLPTRMLRQFGPPGAKMPEPDQPAPVSPEQSAGVEKVVKKKKPMAKVDPKLVAAARELRDRWTEEVQSGRLVIEGNGKYDVARLIAPSDQEQITPALPAAA